MRPCLVRRDDSQRDFLFWVLSVIPFEYKQVLTNIHTSPGAILRVYNCDRRIDKVELSFVYRDLYQLIESINKVLRRYKERLSRKFSFEDNLRDVFTRIICQSDPVLLTHREVKKVPPIINTEAISNQDIMVNSFILDTH